MQLPQLLTDFEMCVLCICTRCTLVSHAHHMHVTCALTTQVYDVSKFLARHPGGSEQLMLGAGRDVTQLFESYHPFDVYK